MRLATTLILLASAAASIVHAQCASSCVRREFRSLSTDERARYFAAVAGIMTNGRYDELRQQHVDNAAWTHNDIPFFPWHRAMMRQFELALQEIDPSVCAHYWDWTLDSQAPEASQVWSAAGGNYAAVNNGGCARMAWFPSEGAPCVRRDWNGDGSLGSFTTPEALQRMLNTQSYATFRRIFEQGPHAQPHNNIGGNMATMNSPTDPIFYAHHGMVDKVWAEWQRANPSLANTYPGSTSEQMSPFAWTVEQLFDTSSLCYSYADVRVGVSAFSAIASHLVRRSDEDEQVVTAAKANANATVSDEVGKVAVYDSNDRGNLRALRYPSKISDDYIRAMGYKQDEVREQERDQMAFIDRINAIPGYVSPCALYRRADLMAGLIRHANGTAKQFYIDVAGTKQYEAEAPKWSTSVTADTLANEIQQVRRDFAAHVPGWLQGSDDVLKAVTAMTGPWTGDRQSAANFELAAKGGVEGDATPVLPGDGKNGAESSGATMVRAASTIASTIVAVAMAAYMA